MGCEAELKQNNYKAQAANFIVYLSYRGNLCVYVHVLEVCLFVCLSL